MLIKQNLISFVLIGLKLIITKPKALIHLFKNLNKSNPNITDNGEYAELLSIGVSDTKQGQGLGKKLMIKLESELISKGCENLSLTTDYFNNESAVEFYKISGFTIFYDFIAYPNRKMYRMIKKLNLI
jgi:ribosomal protein S18 acetylase RimI-like enzyme